MIVSAGFEEHKYWVGFLLLLASAGTFLHTGLKVPYFIWFGKNQPKKETWDRAAEPPKNMMAAMAAAAVLCIFIGCYTPFLYKMLPYPEEAMKYVPYTSYHISETLQILLFTGLGFFLLIKKLAPTPTISLDLDWFYRMGGRAFLWLARKPIQMADTFVGELYRVAGLAPLMISARVAGWFDNKIIDGAVDGLAESVRGAGRRLRLVQRGPMQQNLAISFAVAAALYLGSGFFIVPPDSAGYEFFCGRRLGAALPPGLHYWIPRPLGRRDVWRTLYPRKNDIGFNTDLTQLAQRREIMKNVNPEQWHSPVAAMSAQKTETSYLTGDENLVNASFTVHYGLSDPYAFFYRVGKDANVVSRYAQAAAREFIAKSTLDDLLTHDRSNLEQFIARDLQQHLDEIGAGVRIGTVHLVDIHPPQDAVFAFRDASSAREDRETRIHQAYETLARETPKARGQATLDVARAQAAADTAATIAAGKSEAFLAQAQAFAGHANLLGYLLWLEMAERVLPGREKFIVPGGTAGRDVIFWRDAPSLFSAAAPPPPTAAAPTSAIGSSQSQTLPTGAPKK